MPNATLARTVRELLPKGRSLPDEDWNRRHRGILVVLWIHAVGLPFFAVLRGYALQHAVLEGLLIVVPSLAATGGRLDRNLRMAAATFGLVASSAVLVHLSGGVIEMHFHYFVVVAVVTLYQSWLPFLLAIAFVLLQHGLVGVIDPSTVFNHPAAIANPWKWAGIHAIFIAAESAACLTAWRMSEAASARAEESDRQRATLVEFSDDAIIGLDPEGRITSWNPAAQRLLGYRASEAVGTSIAVLIPPERTEIAQGVLERVAGGESIRDWEGFVLTKDERRIPLSLTVSPIVDSHDTVAGISIIVRDITKHKQAEEQLAAARDQALEVSRLKSDFLANMSHEIRTPMNGVLGMTDLLIAGDLDPRQREYAETIRRSGDALLRIIDEILDFSKIEAGKVQLQTTDFDIRILVEDVRGLLAQLARDKGLELASLIHPAVPQQANGDPGRLRQVLVNLVGNAIKFTTSGEVVVRAQTVRDADEETLVRFEIADTGVGISPEAQARLFESFFQVDSSSTREHGGTGLGLAISRQLVQLMGGEIGVRSERGKGSTFWFTVPLGRPSRPPVPSAPPDAEGLHGLRLLVVGPDSGERAELADAVAGTGMHVDLAATEEEARSLLECAADREEGYDVVLIDLELPGRGGLALSEELAQGAATKSVPTILFTASGVHGDSDAARRAGASGYLTTPLEPAQLAGCIAAVRVAARQEPAAGLVTRHSLKEAAATARARVLVADDNVVNQRVAVLMLERLGCRADVVADGREATDAVAGGTYAAVLMDCQMPRMDGYAATAEIRRREGGNRHTPIIAMTAAAMAQDRDRCLAVGMDGYISKPVRPEELADALGRWIDLGTSGEDAATASPARPPS